MELEWTKREHEAVDAIVERDMGSQMALKRVRLYMFLELKRMRAQVIFL
jgi:hypothetical protein